jgi:N-acetylglutamate synthase-like GNAT family acetyltransferase
MVIREAIDKDIPSILKVLKESLGESSSRKSAEVWNYKHLENPFGKSLVLVAEENDEIIGVRAFMKWKWNLGEKNFSAFRAVDTATHPKYQGKGIFKKLTLQALENAKQTKGNFIFNTPNDQSKPGYLKMGWKTIGKVRVKLVPVFSIFNSKENSLISTLNSETLICRPEILQVYNEQLKKKEVLFTAKTPDFIKWRYFECKLQKYLILNDPNYFAAAYIKNHKYFKELRVSELIYSNTTLEREISGKLRRLAKFHNANVISFSSSLSCNNMNGLNGNFGPDLTLRELNFTSDYEKSLCNINNWSNSLGDLELF